MREVPLQGSGGCGGGDPRLVFMGFGSWSTICELKFRFTVRGLGMAISPRNFRFRWDYRGTLLV